MNIEFTRIENYYGIKVYFSKNAEDDFYMTNNLISGLENVNIKFKQFRINTPLSELFKSLVIVKGNKERAEIDKNFKSALHNWKAFLETDIKAIVFDLSKFKNEEQLINTLVHEIGHCIHVNFVSSDSSEYITLIGETYTNIIRELKSIKDIIENNNDDERNEKLLNDAEESFYDFADFLDNNSEGGFSSISSQICKDYELSDKFTPLSKIENMIESIMKHMPSEYGSTDEREFFAECFRQFILSPDQLSLANRNMIINSLTMSRVQGKTVINAHKLIKDYVKAILS
jgi:hypothetical protein